VFHCTPGDHDVDGPEAVMVFALPEPEWICADCWHLMIIWAKYGAETALFQTVDVEILNS
jgi:hypothetical protein